MGWQEISPFQTSYTGETTTLTVKMIACWWCENNLWNFNGAISLNGYNKYTLKALHVLYDININKLN